MTHPDMAYEETEDRFYAQFDSREVALMTLDELAAAFEDGRIHGNTFVCREGDSEWATLAEVAGLGEEEPEPAPTPVVVAERRPPMPNRAPVVVPETRSVVVAETRPPMPARRPAMNTQPAARFQAAVGVPSIVPVVSSTSLSVAPVASTIGSAASVDLEVLAFRPKRRWGGLLAVAAVLSVVGGGAAFALGGGAHAFASAVPSDPALEAAGSKSPASLTPDNVQPKAADPTPAAAPPAPSTPDPLAAVAPSATATDAPTTDAAPKFSDDMKQALLAADKAHQSKHAAKVAHAGSGVAHHRKAVSSSTGFKSGGSAYDPLNGKL
jgi:hypothetical protein